MEVEVLRISVTDDGSARVVSRNLENVGKAGGRAAQSTALLRQALIGLGAAAIIRQISSINDQFITLSNRVRIFADNQEASNQTMRDLLDIAARTRTGLEGTTELYSRLTLASDSLGLSQERVLGVTELVAKAVGASGASTSAATGAIVQFGQAVSANFKAASQELNSIIEATPVLAKAIADGLGVPVSALKELAKEGKLTSEQVIQALESQREALDAYTERMQSTVPQATQQVTDAITILIGGFLQTTNAGATVTATVETLAAKIRDLASNSAAMERAGQGMINFLEDIIQRGRVVIRIVGEIATAIISLANASAPAILLRVATGQSLDEALENSFGPLREQIKALPEFGRELERLSVAPIFTRAKAGAGGGAFPEVPKPAPAFNLGEIAAVDRAASREAENAAKAAAREAERAAKARQQAIDDFIKLRGELDPVIEAGNRYAESIRTINAAAETGAFSQEQIAQAVAGVTAEFEKARNAASTEAVEEFRRLQESLDPAIAAGREYARTLQIINEAAKTGAVSQQEIAAAVEQATAAYQKARDEAKSTGDTILESVAGQFDNALNSLVNFANTGKASIGEFAASAVADLQRVFLKLLLVKSLEGLAGAFGGAGGGGLGGIFGSLAGLIGGARAEGGPVSPGKVFLVGEKGPELFVPPTRGNILANDALENGAGAARTPVNVNLDLDPMRMVDVLQTREAEGVILSVLQRNRSKLREVVS